jgi:putative chitinase
LGNCAPGDGYRFRGGGDLQLTGRKAYTHIGELVGVDLVSNPDMLAEPAISFRVAVAEFVALKCVEPASRGQTAVVRRLVNGGNNGLAEVTVWVRKWEEALPGVEAPEAAPRGTDSTNKTLMSSKIMQGAVGTAGSIGTAVVSKVAENANTSTSVVNIQDVSDKIQQASDTITTVQLAKDNVTAIVQTVKPFLGLAPSTWATIAVLAIVAASVFILFTIWERHKKLRDQGV